MKAHRIDPSRVRLRASSERISLVTYQNLITPEMAMSLQYPASTEVDGLAAQIVAAHRRKAPVIFFLSGHIIKHGLTPLLVDLLQRGVITHVACNGSVMIHDWELFTTGATSEPVAQYIMDGSFGNWDVPSMLNEIVRDRYDGKRSLGDMLSQCMFDDYAPNKYYQSLIRTCYQCRVPITFHVLVGGDIIHQHPNARGDFFAASYNDFLEFGGSVSRMNQGVFVNLGSQVTGTEVFLKALSMARNIAMQDGTPLLHDITTGMADFVKLPSNWRDGTCSEGEAAYYYRPWKTLLLRTVANGGRSFYLSGPHTETLPQLWKAITEAM